MQNVPPNQNLLQAIQAASELIRRKEPAAAEQSLRGLLKSSPDNALVVHLLGIAMVEQGRLDDGTEMIRKSLRLRPNDANLRNNFAVVLHNHGRPQQAMAEYRRTIEMSPQMPEPYANLGKLLLESRECAEAAKMLQKAAQFAPNHPEILNDWGVSLLKQHKFDEAEGLFRRAIALHEPYAVAHNSLGTVLHQKWDLPASEREMRRAIELDPLYVKAYENLGLVLLDAERMDEAAAVLRCAVERCPNSPDAHRGLGNVLSRLQRFDEALAEMRRAEELRGRDPQILLDLARVYHSMDRLDEAEAALKQARELEPRWADIHSAIAYTHFLRGQIAESVAANEEALRIDPDNSDFRMARAVDLLLLGDWQRGWPQYEYRLKIKNITRRFAVPQWDGGPLDGRTILLHSEQGFGDAIQFCRYAPLVAQRGGRVILECRRPLVRLLQSIPHVEKVLTHGDGVPAFDVHCPMLSLPCAMQTRLDNVPNAVPYLQAPPEEVAAWRARLGRRECLRVGLAWRGLPSHVMNRRRSISLQMLAPILAVPNVAFYSIQMNGATEIAQAGQGQIADLTPHITDFADTAAALSQLDLLICVDTGVAHLAGALNVPVWMLLYFPGEWRWLLDPSDSPWYPSMRIFRQRRIGDWADIIEEVAAELRRRAEAS